MTRFYGTTEGMSDTGLAVHRFRIEAGWTLSEPKQRVRGLEHSMESAVRRLFPDTKLTGAKFENIESRIPSRQKQLTLREAYEIARTFDVPVIALMVDLTQPYRMAEIARPRRITVMQFVAEQYEPIGKLNLSTLRDDDVFMPVKAALKLTSLCRSLGKRLESYGDNADESMRARDMRDVKAMGALAARLSRNMVNIPMDERKKIQRVIEDAAARWNFDWQEVFGFEWRYRWRKRKRGFIEPQA